MDLFINCPGCGDRLIGIRSKVRRDLTFLCSDCGIQTFVRGHRGLYRITKIRQGQSVFYQWVVCHQCKIAINQDALRFGAECPGCGLELVHGLDGSEGYSEEEVLAWKAS